ncbi:flavin reductase family protein [Mesorhizobium sp. B2-4-17]|uniref:flavin reductase family protein n=1 Tax=Mesorhizobium sp. B2-4-17 TaxID=2589932 RepID=UPI0011261A70|nr:flavin reductase family protein [Mesorhizobium sp. B2-4-17]TPK91505.1 flavin reductase [Mesorhizobium sp. B2-4-17]
MGFTIQMEQLVMDKEKLSYRRLIGRFATGVAVIVGESDGDVIGMTVNSLTSVSLDPLLLLFCAKNESRTADRILSSTRFSVNILRRDQQNVSRRFAGKADVEMKACAREDGFAWVDGANAVFLCEVEHVYPGGDHKIIVGRVVSMNGPDDVDEPLVFFDGRYTALQTLNLEYSVA